MIHCVLAAALTIVSSVLWAAPVSAEPYPDRTIKVIVPFAAGGGVDVMARVFSEKAASILGVPVIVENRAGATVGALAVQQAQPDGYTLLFAPLTHVMSNHVLKSVPYDPVNDFTPIARVAESPLLAVMTAKMAPNTLADVAAAARARPNEWSIATSGLGSLSHFAAIELRNVSKADIAITPYRGTAPAMTDVIGGHVQLMIDSIVTLLPPARDGKVKALAITTAKRNALAPEVPTVAESGMPGLEFTAWYGFFGPKGMPPDVVAKLNATFNKAGPLLAGEKRLAPLGADPVAETPEQFGKFVRAQVDRYSKLLDSAGYKPE